ncbi:cell division protein FtsL [Wenzhouxiangella sp. XN79A]|uniref:cell division protein FtsL n=1 Tax=Wenzhouxiangella sp. XN79A TaxID=2724193 RepID=UPI00144AE5DD|nr:cell division protein FtsL [Wenzhouxiangella sp. XN79A]NKI34334.1 cell division protein FtsL [Wenzhouxiangella sp. XN79A]
MKTWIALIVLLAATVASAVALVGARHEARQLFIQLEAAAQQHDAERVEWSRLQLELAFLGESSRIEAQARESLGMRQPRDVGLLVRSDG